MTKRLINTALAVLGISIAIAANGPVDTATPRVVLRPATKRVVNVVGFTPGVFAPIPMQMGKFTLQAGANKVSFMIVGKAGESSGHYAGIDRIRFYPAGP